MPDSLRPHGLLPTRLLCPWDFPGKDTGVGCHFLLQGIFPTQGSNPGLLHCRQILYLLSHRESESESPSVVSDSLPAIDYIVYGILQVLQAKILEWVAFPFSRVSSQPRDRTQVSHVAVGFFTSWVWLISILYPVIWTWKSELSVWNNYSNSIPCFP